MRGDSLRELELIVYGQLVHRSIQFHPIDTPAHEHHLKSGYPFAYRKTGDRPD